MEENSQRNIVIHPLTPDDCPALLEMIREFAAYVGCRPEEVSASVDSLREVLFGKTSAEALIGEVDGQAAGYMIYYPTFSTFLSRPCLFMEDLFIRRPFQRSGLGNAFMTRITAIARERNCPRIEWCCLDDNINAISFYANFGGRRLIGTGVYRLEVCD